MKMISQLTRQAMNRHRLLSTDTSRTAVSSIVPNSSSSNALPTQNVTIRNDSFLQENRPHRFVSAPIQSFSRMFPQPRPQTIYSQLMKSHDRMTKRHLST